MIAALCVAVCGLLSVQGAMAAVDRVQHSFDVPHAASPLGGPVVDDHSHGPGDHQHADEEAGEERDDHPSTHHHHAGDHHQFVSPTASTADTEAAGELETAFAWASTVHAGLSGSSLERPPRV